MSLEEEIEYFVREGKSFGKNVLQMLKTTRKIFINKCIAIKGPYKI